MTATAASAALLTRSPRHTELHLGPLTELRVDARPAPLITLLSIVVDALGGPAQGSSPELVRMVRKAVPADAAYDVCSVFDSTGALFPDCVPLVADRDSMNALFDDIAEVRPDTLWRSVVELFDGVPPLVWQMVLQRPERWLQQLVRVLAAAWRLYEPIWRRTSALRARESDRVAAATEGGDLDVVLAGLSPRTRYSQETLYLPDRFPYRTEMGGRQLVLVPLTSGRQASVFNLDLPDEAWVGYPLPGISGPLPGNGSNGDAAPEALTLLLGPMRASILCALHQPATMGALARRLNAAPSTVTYHCGQLADAGLVARQRHGREVRVKRTDRGGAVVDALS